MLDHPSIPTAARLRLGHVVAMAENRVIGRDGQLPWHIPEDFRIFKNLTHGHALIMGRKTFESIGRPLPGRLSIVLTRDRGWRPALADPASVVVVASIAEALARAAAERERWGDEAFIIGGGELFTATLPLVDTVYLTRVHTQVDGDTQYPALPAEDFRLTRSVPSQNEPRFTWEIHVRQPPACNEPPTG